MSRSKYKSFFIKPYLLYLLLKKKVSEKLSRVFTRSLKLNPLVDVNLISVYNGRRFRAVPIQKIKFNHKLGEFAQTRAVYVFKKKKKKKNKCI